MSFLSPGGQPCRDPCILTLGTPDVPEFPLSNTRMRPADALGALITGNVRDRNCGPDRRVVVEKIGTWCSELQE